MTQKKQVAPDGGWGWVIMFACALHNMVCIPIMQSFGLLFKDTFVAMGMSATDGTIIMTTNAAFAMIMGLVNGPLLNRFSFRKVACGAAGLLVMGLISTAYSTAFHHYLIAYGLITSFGMGIGMPSYSLALNSYFLKNRNKATGFSYTITGLGSIFMPQLISLLLSIYSVKGALLIIAGISAHAFISALLLQPVQKHMKTELDKAEGEEDETKEELLEKSEKFSKALLDKRGRKYSRENSRITLRKQSSLIESNMSINHDAETQSIYGFDVPSPTTTTVQRTRRASTSDRHQKHLATKWWSSTHSINSVHLGSSVKIFDEKDKTIVPIEEDQEEAQAKDQSNEQPLVYSAQSPAPSPKSEEPGLIKKILQNIVNFFDLSLLNDLIYLNIMLGMSIAIFAELNFSLLTPFILSDIGLSTQDIATFLSILSAADMVFRFISPFVGDYFKQSARVMYMISLCLLVITRYSLLMFTSIENLYAVAFGLGVAKGIRTVYMTLVIPSYVPLERLASASGLQMVVNGLFIIAGGPVLGVIRDISGSYTNCIFVMNAMTICTLVMWTIEIMYQRIKSRNKENTIEKG